MSSPARHHAEWLSLLEISGPFLSLPVLLDVFPQGLDAHDSDLSHSLRAAHEEWADNQGGVRPDPAIHSAWIRYVLTDVLEFSDATLLEGQTIPSRLRADIPEHGIWLQPDLALTSPEGVRLLINVYHPSQELDKPPSGGRWKASVATQMMELLHATEVKLGLVTNGEQWMLVHASKGETTGFISWYAHLWFDEPLTLRAFNSLLGLRRFFGVPAEQTLEAMLERSTQDQHDVTDRLGYQVRQAVEILIRDLDEADSDRGRALLADVSEACLYEAALTVMMRLVFLLSAEERKLLPLDDPFYAEYYAVSTLRAQLREAADQLGEDVLERRTDAWNRLLATFRAVYAGMGHDRLKMIAYGGSLFDPDRFPFLEGRPVETSWRDTPADPLPVDNRTVLHLLEALQLLRVNVPGGGKETRRLSFRALDIEQIGHVYESLLDHIAVRADTPVVGLTGTKNKEPEIPLPALEKHLEKGRQELVDFLRDETGRTKGALRNGLDAETDAFRAQRLRAACGNDETLYRRVEPFAGLIRDDDNGFPVVIPAGSVYVTAGPTRRATGTHYTPRSLTEPIVQHTLEPLVYIGPAEGKPKEEWTLKTPEALLDLKICDMAMGSGAFLVQVIRYLSERLVESWEMYGDDVSGVEVPSVRNSELEKNLIPDPGSPDTLVTARRLVADRCIYGVDKNPLAVEMAKLSLWLITLDRAKPFSFLDHSLKCGDSLVGASEEDFLRWARGLLNDPAYAASKTLFDETLQEQVKLARQKRAELQSFQVLDLRDAERKAFLFAEAEAALERVKLGCDLLVGVKLLGLNQREQEGLSSRLLLDYVAGEAMEKPDAQDALNATYKERAFHWEFEFPEVFERGGFSAFVGNPPFLGGTRISTEYGDKYLAFLRQGYPSFKNRADLCSLFFIQSHQKSQDRAAIGLIATNTISQGDTKEAGLETILLKDVEIFRALSSISWPGQANVYISVVHIFISKFQGTKILDDKKVECITSSLDDFLLSPAPEKLVANQGLCYTGSKLDGIGFAISPDEKNDLIAQNNKNSDVLLPYLNGQDINSHPEHHPSRYVIYFRDWPIEKASKYSDCLEIVKERVYPSRVKHREKRTREHWWLFQRIRTELYNTIQPLTRALVIAQTSKTAAFAFVPTTWIYNQKVVIFAFDDASYFSVMQSAFHVEWTWQFSSTLGKGLSYATSDCFDNFPFPELQASPPNLQFTGEAYHKHRRQIMLARQEGLTKTYNRFHNPEESAADIAQLRELHIEMDQVVAVTYGWDDLSLDHDFYETPQGIRFTISESARREVLSRLLELNHQRYAEEVAAGLHEKKSKKKAKKKKTAKTKKAKQPKDQPKLFAVEKIAEEKIESPSEENKATPTDQIGSWDQCTCLGCGKHLGGFMVAEHTEKVHGGENPGYRKVG